MRGREVGAEVGGHTDVCHPSIYWSEEKARKVPLGHHLVLLVQPLEGLLVVVGQRDGVVWSAQCFGQLCWWAVVAAQGHALGVSWECLAHWGSSVLVKWLGRALVAGGREDKKCCWVLPNGLNNICNKYTGICKTYFSINKDEMIEIDWSLYLHNLHIHVKYQFWPYSGMR